MRGRKIKTSPYHQLQKQLFVRGIGLLGVFSSGSLILVFTNEEYKKYGINEQMSPITEAFQMIPAFITLTSTIMGVLLAMFVIGKSLTFTEMDLFHQTVLNGNILNYYKYCESIST